MLPELIDHTDQSPSRYRRTQARVAGTLATVWARRLAIALGVPESMRTSLQSAARHVTMRNFCGTLRESAMPLVSRYRHPIEDDLAVGLLRVAETFAIGSMQPWAAPRATLDFMRSLPTYYPSVIVAALENEVGLFRRPTEVQSRRGEINAERSLVPR